ncbi:hypothetical protein C806_01978 [Lachnospiraceae bacterium 3-1]|nr:hypothetical protein C806_01978 [Lachnospiraceae bacterium 3-1]
MFDEKEKKDLDLLIEMGKKQANKLSSMIISNYFVGFPSKKQTEAVYKEIILYLEQNGIEIVDDGSEIEKEDAPLPVPEIRPFDPSKIDIDMKTMELSSIIERLEYNEINMNTDFQRKSGLWTPVQKSQLIESLLLRIPIPAFYFDGGKKDNWLIIDGLQRITALKEFVVDGTLELCGLEFFHDLEGMKYKELPRTFVRRIKETNIVAYIVKGGTPANVKYNIFKRINTGGLELKPQEIRHALYQGRATSLCKKFAKFPEFQTATTYSIRDDRMMDQEFVLRFVAVCYYGIEKYEGISDNYLNGAMEYLNSSECADEAELEKQFKRVMVAAKNIMGKYAFRKLGEDKIRRPINKAIFEAWCRSLYTLDNAKVALLEQRKGKVYYEFLELCNHPGFLQAIKASDKKSFSMRFTYISDMLKGVLYDTTNESR